MCWCSAPSTALSTSNALPTQWRVCRAAYRIARMSLDKRLNAYRPDVADARLRGRVEAQRFVEGRPMQVSAPITAVRREASPDAIQLSQALMGEAVTVF